MSGVKREREAAGADAFPDGAGRKEKKQKRNGGGNGERVVVDLTDD